MITLVAGFRGAFTAMHALLLTVAGLAVLGCGCNHGKSGAVNVMSG